MEDRTINGALSGISVIELGSYISAPYCTKLLADLGAEVIKVEEPELGDEARLHGPFLGDIPHPERSGLFLYLNANKRGITLDVRTGTGRDIFSQLLKKSDICVTNLPPALLEEVKLTPSDMRRYNSNLIAVSISPFGQSGPYSNYRGYDINCAGLSGVSDCTRDPHREPLRLPLDQSHYQGGSHAAAAALVALLARNTIGKGQQVEISEADVWAAYHQPGRINLFIREGRLRRRSGHRSPGLYPYTILPCKDGYVSMLAGRSRQWKAFLELIGGGKIPAWYANDPRFTNRFEMGWKYADEMDSLLAPWLMAHTKEEIFALCQERGIPFTPVYNMEEVLHHYHLKARDYFVEIKRPEAGSLRYPGAPYKLSKTPWRIRRPAPRLGEHNEEIYSHYLDFTKEELVRLRQNRII